MNRKAVAKELIKVAKLLSAIELRPKAAPDINGLRDWHDKMMSLLRKAGITKPGEYAYDTGWGGSKISISDAKEILQLAKEMSRIFEHNLQLGFIKKTGYDHSFEDYRNWAEQVFVSPEIMDSDWPEKVAASYGGAVYEIPEDLGEKMDLFLRKSHGRGYVPRSPKEGAFLKFKAVELLEDFKRAGAKITDEKITRSRNNPNFYATVEYLASFGNAMTFKISIGWVRHRGENLTELVAGQNISPKYEIQG